MNVWYSPRGARRGLLFAALLIALWSCWAAGYAQAALHFHATPTVTLQHSAPDAEDDTCLFIDSRTSSSY